jgi:hypothetical protein
MTVLFGRTQEAIDTPFTPNRNPGFGGVPSEIESTNVQDAIEEAKLDALNNDRFLVLGSYNGNANVGRYVEFFPAISSFDAPIFLAASARCLSLVISATANTTATLGVFNLAVSSTVPIYSATYNGTTRTSFIGSPASPLFSVPSNAQLAIRVTSGSASKPYLQISLSAST